MKGVVKYDQAGNPVCEICGKSYARLMTHVRQKHDMTAYEYKKQFGLCTTKSVMNELSRKKSRLAALRNYDKVVTENLIEGGIQTRYEKGSKGRTRDMLCEQSIIILKTRNLKITEKMMESGRKVVQ